MNRHERRKQATLERRQKRWDGRVREEMSRQFGIGICAPRDLFDRMWSHAEAELRRRIGRKPPMGGERKR